MVAKASPWGKEWLCWGSCIITAPEEHSNPVHSLGQACCWGALWPRCQPQHYQAGIAEGFGDEVSDSYIITSADQSWEMSGPKITVLHSDAVPAWIRSAHHKCRPELVEPDPIPPQYLAASLCSRNIPRQTSGSSDLSHPRSRYRW